MDKSMQALQESMYGLQVAYAKREIEHYFMKQYIIRNPAAVALVDPLFKYQLYSLAWTETLGLSAYPDLLGKSHLELFPSILQAECYKDLHSLGLAGKPFVCGVDRISGDVPVEWHFDPFPTRQDPLMLGGYLIWPRRVDGTTLLQRGENGK